MGKPLRPRDLAMTQSQKNIATETGSNIGGDGNAAITPLSDKGQRGGVISRKKPKFCSDHHSQARDATWVAGGVFETRDLR